VLVKGRCSSQQVLNFVLLQQYKSKAIPVTGRGDLIGL
jgi:hypothetical protein